MTTDAVHDVCISRAEAIRLARSPDEYYDLSGDERRAVWREMRKLSRAEAARALRVTSPRARTKYEVL